MKYFAIAIMALCLTGCLETEEELKRQEMAMYKSTIDRVGDANGNIKLKIGQKNNLPDALCHGQVYLSLVGLRGISVSNCGDEDQAVLYTDHATHIVLVNNTSSTRWKIINATSKELLISYDPE